LGVDDFFVIFACMHTSKVNCNEMAEDKPRQCAIRNF